ARGAEPDNPDFAFLNAEVCFFRDRPEQAMALYEKAAGSSGRRIAARVRQVGCLTTLDRVDEALALANDILDKEAGAPRAELLAAKAQLFTIQGDKYAAQSLAREALVLKRGVAAAWFLLVQLDAAALSDADVDDMVQLLPEADAESRITLGFALAGVFEARGELERQLDYLA